VFDRGGVGCGGKEGHGRRERRKIPRKTVPQEGKGGVFRNQSDEKSAVKVDSILIREFRCRRRGEGGAGFSIKGQVGGFRGEEG